MIQTQGMVESEVLWTTPGGAVLTTASGAALRKPEKALVAGAIPVVGKIMPRSELEAQQFQAQWEALSKTHSVEAVLDFSDRGRVSEGRLSVPATASTRHLERASVYARLIIKSTT